MFGVLQFTRRETIGKNGVQFQSVCGNHTFPVNTNIKSFVNRWVKVSEKENHELMEILGTVGNYFTESDILKRHYHILPCKYPSYNVLPSQHPIQNECSSIINEVFTVDDEHTKDMDDALSVTTIDDDGNTLLGIHVTDVASFINERLNDDDRETLLEWITERCSSAYFESSSSPMFPPHIAHNELSLIPNEQRKSISLYLRINKEGQLTSHTWKSDTIVNKNKLTYTNFPKVKTKEYELLTKLSNTKDPHEMIAWTMTTYNKLFAGDYLQKDGILRTKVSDSLAEYSLRDNTINQNHCDMDNMIYTHATSPIRRVVDIYNQTLYHNNPYKMNVDIFKINEKSKDITFFHRQHAILELSHRTRESPVTAKINKIDKLKNIVEIEYDRQRYKIPRFDTFYEGEFIECEQEIEIWGIVKNNRSTLRLRNLNHVEEIRQSVYVKDDDDDKLVSTNTILDKSVLEECMGYPLDTFQLNCLEVVNANNDLFGTAPTGSGKTTVALMGILKAFHSGKRAIFSSPIKALSNEKYADMKQRLNGRVSLLTGDMKVRCTPPGGDGSPELLIMTAEILRNKLNNGNDPDLIDVTMVVIDECHYINDTDRGPVWEETLLLLSNTIQVVALSATLSSPEDFCKWMSKRRLTKCVQHHERAVPLLIGSMRNETFKEITNTNKIGNGIGVSSELYSWKDPPKQSDTPVQLVKQLIQNDMCPAIIFCMSRRRCVQMADSFTGSLMVSKRPYRDSNTNTNGYEREVYDAKLKDWDEEVLDHKRKFQIYVKRYLKPWRSQLEKLQEYHTFIELLYKGVAYHHSGMIPVLREFVEILFRNKMILAVFATESLGVGIDMPARTTVFTQLDKPVGNDCGFRNLYTHEFMQMAGRAGRRGKDVKGYVVYYPVAPSKRGGVSYPEFKSMVLGKPPKAESQLKITPDFVIRNYEKGYEHMNGSLLGHCIAKEIIANSLLSPENDNIDTIIQIGKLNDKLMGVTSSGNMFLSLDRKQTKKVKNELRQHIEELNMDIGDVLKIYKEYKHINTLRDYMSNEWDDSVQLLEDLHFIKDSRLTTYGKVASIMCDGMPMVRAYVIVSNLLDKLSMEEIVSWLGLFAWGMTEIETDEANEYIGDHHHNNMTTLIEHTCEYSKYIYDKEIINPHYKVNLIYEWIKYKNVETIVQYTGLSEFGNFIKTMLRISSFVEEIRTIVMGLERYDLYNRFENYEERIFYGIVSNSSIYV